MVIKKAQDSWLKNEVEISKNTGGHFAIGKMWMRNYVSSRLKNDNGVTLRHKVIVTMFVSVFCMTCCVECVREASLQNAREDVFSSTSKLEDLVQNELQVLDLLTTFTEYTIEKANLIKS